MSEFREIVGKVQGDPKVRAVVVSSSKPDCFIAGADVAYVFWSHFSGSGKHPKDVFVWRDDSFVIVYVEYV